MRMPDFDPESGWRPTPVGELPAWPERGRVGIDVETRDPDLENLGPGVRRGAYVVGVSFAIEDGPSHYLPVAHEGGDNLPRDKVICYLMAQAKRFDGDLAGANLQYDLDFLEEAGVRFSPRRYRDTQLAAPLLNELHLTYSLEDIAEREGIPGKDEALLGRAAACYGVDPKKDLWRLPAKYVGPYAVQDARLPLLLLRRQERKLEDEDLWDVWDVESRLLPVLLKMRRRGVRVDFDQLDKVERYATGRELDALAQIRALTGHSLTPDDTNKASALAPVIQGLGYRLPLTENTKKPSVTNEVLERVDHPVGELIRTARKFNKLRGTFVKSIRTHAVGDRVHCTFNQLRKEKDSGGDSQGARYGRTSSTDPNLQQQPSRDPEIGPMWRAIYLPDEGAEWACRDYSQQEPRWLTHFAAILDPPCRGAVKAAETYRRDPDTDNHQMVADMIGIERAPAKTIYLGLCYGMGGGKLARSLGLPTFIVPSKRLQRDIEVAGHEGRALLEKFHAGAPYVRELSNRLQAVAEKHGYIRTVLGRKCRFPEKRGGGWDWTHLALNREVQGSSGDQMKKAMVDADGAGIPIQLQVHDELNLSVADRRQVAELDRVMLDAVPCSVPHKVDGGFGPNWAEAK